MKTTRMFFATALKDGPKNFATLRKEFFVYFPNKTKLLSLYFAFAYAIDTKLVRRVRTWYYTGKGKACSTTYVLTKKGAEVLNSQPLKIG